MIGAPVHKSVYNRKNPYLAKLKARRDLTPTEEAKVTMHYEIDLDDSGLEFEPGDSLAIQPSNDPTLVDEVLGLFGFTGDEEVVDPRKEEKPIRQALIESCSLGLPDKKFLRKVVEKAEADAAELAPLLAPDRRDDLNAFLWGREVVDFLLAFPGMRFEPQEFVDTLRKLQVRLYSIASSLKAFPREVHLIIASVRFESHGRRRFGVATSFIGSRVLENETPIPVFVTPGKGFRLPGPDEDTPVIMIGPGTGIAPFRSFLQERRATQAKGKSWLFFGEIQEETCFFYRDELERDLADGILTRLTTAWSRDQARKIYVHHKIRENAGQFYEWLEDGAILYVCGDALRMAGDVNQALHDVIREQGGKSDDEAAEYIAQMLKDKRYRRDIY